jgi:CRP-like cAMP-binding protein
MKVLARRLQDTNNVLAASSFLAANGRVAGALLSLAEARGERAHPARAAADVWRGGVAFAPLSAVLKLV